MVRRDLDPLQQKKKELAERRKKQLQEILKRGGGGTGRGGGGGLPPLPTVEQARQELAREQQVESKAELLAKQKAERIRGEELARQQEQQRREEAIRLQREQAQRIKDQISRQREQVRKIKLMSIPEKQQFFKEQRELSKAQEFLKLEQRGKKLTPEAKQTLERVTEKIGKEIEEREGKEVIIQRQIGTERGIPILETIVKNEKTGKERKPTAEEFRLIRKLSLTVLPAKTQKEIFLELKKVYTPTFLGSSFIANKVQSFIGSALARGKLAEKDLGKGLFNLRDASGQRIFNETQAIQSGKLISETIKGFVLGLGTGKALKLLGLSAKTLGKIGGIRGVKSFQQFVNPSVSRLLPKVLTESEKQILSKGVQIGLISGLTAIETKRIINTARTEGKKSALLQMIGLTAFIGGARIGAKDFKKLTLKQQKAIRMNVKQFELNIVKTQDKRTIELLNKAKEKIFRELKQFKGVTRAKKIKQALKDIKSEAILRKRNIRKYYDLKIRKLKDLGAVREERFFFQELSSSEKNRLIEDSAENLLRRLERKFNKKITATHLRDKINNELRKVIKNRLNKGVSLFKTESEIITLKKPYLSRVKSLFKPIFSTIKSIKKRKKLKELGILIPKKKKTPFNKAKEKIFRELKQFKGVTRAKKIKQALKDIKSEAILRKRNIRKYYDLKIRKLKDLGAVREERFFFQELSSSEKNRLIEDSAENLLRRLERKFNKKITATHLRDKINNELRKVIKNRLNKGVSLFKTESEIITLKKPYLSRVKSLFKPIFSTIKSIKKRKKLKELGILIPKKKKTPFKITSKLKDLSFIEKKALRENLKNKLIKLYNKRYGKLIPEEQRLLEKKVNSYVNLNSNLNKKVSVVESRLIDTRLSRRILLEVRKVRIKLKRIPAEIKQKIFPKKVKVREVINLDRLAFQGQRKEIKIISKRIADTLEKRSGVKLNKANKNKLINKFNSEIIKRSNSKIELKKFQNQLENLFRSVKSRKDLIKISVVKEKPRISKKKIKPSEADKEKPLFKVTKIKEPKVSREVRVRESGQQQLLLEPQVKAKIRAKAKVFQILDPNSQQFKILQKSAKVKQRSLQQMKIKHRSLQNQKLKMETQIKVLQRDLIQIRAIPRIRIKQKQLMQMKILTKQQSKIKSAFRILSKSIMKSASLIKTLTKDLILIDSRIKISLKSAQRLIAAPTTKLGFPLPKIKEKIQKKVVGKKAQAYNVFAKSRGRLIKINQKPLSENDAKKLGSTIIDNTTARTFLIKRTAGKPQTPILLTKPFQKKKFREHRIIKGKKKKTRDTFIERSKKGSNFLIDTKGEKEGLSLSKGLSQLKKQSKKQKVRVRRRKITSAQRLQLSKAQKVRRSNLKSNINRGTGAMTGTIKRKQIQTSTKKINSPKRQVSQQVLDNLAKGRAKRLANLKKKR